MTFGLSVLAVSGIVTGLLIRGVPIKVDREAPIIQHLARQDQVFGFPSDSSDPTSSWLAPHRNKCERLLADAQVALQRLPSPAAAHGLHLLQIIWVEEGLRGSVTCSALDELLPLVLVKRSRSTRRKVATDEDLVTLCPTRGLAGSVVSGTCGPSKQETDSNMEMQCVRRHSCREEMNSVWGKK